MKKLIYIFIAIILFSVTSQAQGLKEDPPKAKKEKVEFVSLNALVDYMEAVKKGEVEPLDQVTLEKEYARLINELDQEFHTSTPKKGVQHSKSETTSDISEGKLGDIK